MNVQQALDLYKEQHPDVDPELLQAAVEELNYTKDVEDDVLALMKEILGLADEGGPCDDLMNHGANCECEDCEDGCCDDEDDV